MRNADALISIGEAYLPICSYVNVLLHQQAWICMRQDAPRAAGAFLRLKNVGGKNYAHLISAPPGGAAAELAVVIEMQMLHN